MKRATPDKKILSEPINTIIPDEIMSTSIPVQRCQQQKPLTSVAPAL